MGGVEGGQGDVGDDFGTVFFKLKVRSYALFEIYKCCPFDTRPAHS